MIFLTCACCGGEAPSLKQWYNQDDGFGVCKNCFQFHVEKYGIEYAKNIFGFNGVNHSIDDFKIRTKLENILSQFSNSVRSAWAND